MKRFSIPIILVLLGGSSLAAEQSLLVTLHTIGDRIRSQNLELRAARLAVDEALGRQKQAGRLANPDLEVSMQSNDRADQTGFEFGFHQRFPVTSRLRIEKELSATAVAAARKEIAVVENELIGEARVILVEAMGLKCRRSLLNQQWELAVKLANFIGDASKRGEASAIDAGQAKLQAAQLQTECLQLDAAIQRRLLELKPLLGMNKRQSLVFSGVLPAMEVPQREVAEVPSVGLARLEVRKAELAVEMERSRRYDDLRVGVFGGAERLIDEPVGSDREAIIGLKFSVPLPLWNRNEGNIDAARASTDRRRVELAALEQRLDLESSTLMEEMQQWVRIWEEIDTKLLPLAITQSELAEQALRDGQVSLLSVLKSREQRIQLAVLRLDALKNYHLARVRYETALGIH